MWRGLLRKLRGNSRRWVVEVLPGLFVIGLVVGARSLGGLQPLELGTLDLFLRLRPRESIDERITIVEIDEADIERIDKVYPPEIGSYPIPDLELAKLLRTLQQYEPIVIGLDIQRNLPVEPGHKELLRTFNDFENLIAVEKLIPPKSGPPQQFPSDRVGFSDFPYDFDLHVRRHFLGSPDPKKKENYRYSLSLQLAQAYLKKTIKLEVKNGRRDRHAMRFGETEIPRFASNSGGYVQAESGGLQTLLNFRNHPQPFRRVSLHQIETGAVDPTWFRDRIVIVGITAPIFNEPINTSIAELDRSGQIDGVEFHAHAVSQIISAVLDGRSLLTNWPEGEEYLWICFWGLMGISLARKMRSLRTNFFAVGLANTGLFAISHLALMAGNWIPLIPALLALILNNITYVAFSQYGELLKARINERQRLIERTFNVIHNGPLQTLANLLRRVRDESVSPEQLLAALENLNHEIRSLGEHLEREILNREENLYLGSKIKLDLRQPLHELFYQVYTSTLERDFPYFKTLKIKIRNFDPTDSQHLNLEQKRALCRFLEEALCNVGKHAVEATRLIATGSNNNGYYYLCIIDDGPGIASNSDGRGTKQFKKFALLLSGELKRESLASGGTLCELIWSTRKRKHIILAEKCKHKLLKMLQKNSHAL